MDELKPCPFCGSDEDIRVVSEYSEAFYVYCLTCTSCGPSGATSQEAIEAWNRRTGDSK